MPKLSKRLMDPEDMGYFVNNLWNAFTLANSKEEIREIFRDLFTHTEYKMIAKRLEIGRQLLQGGTYEAIKNKLKVTEKPIVHISNILANGGVGLRKTHEKLVDLEKSYQAKAQKRQNILEHRVRRKLPEETILPNLAVTGIRVVSKAFSRKIKHSSAKNRLSI